MESHILNKSSLAQQLNTYILKLNTVYPLFHPVQYLVYAKRYRDIGVKIESIENIKFNNFYQRNIQ